MRLLVAVMSWLMAAALLLIAYVALIWAGPPIEARYWPAVTPIVITRVEAVSETQSRIWVEFDKLRACAPIGVFWYRGRRGGPFDQIGFVVERPRAGQSFVNRPLGKQSAGPWLVDAAPDELGTKVFADAQHSCFPGWTTVSHFYR